MSEVIYKFDVRPLHMAEGEEFPKSAKVLSAGCQQSERTFDIKIWIQLDPDSVDTEMRYFYYVGTGQKLPSGKKIFIGKVQDKQGLVWHVFEALYD